MLIAIRHGKTGFNGTSGSTSEEKFRGWLPIPLTLEGMKTSRETAESLEEIEDVEHLYVSDVVRTIQSGMEIGQVLSLELEPVFELRDWNLGDFVGKEVSKTLKEVLTFIDEPLKKVPGGESYQTFLDRAVPFLKEIVEDDDLCIAVSHARVMGLIAALAKNKGKHPDTKMLKSKPPIGPSGLMIVNSSWEIIFKTEAPD